MTEAPKGSRTVLTLNAGSSTLRFGLFPGVPRSPALLAGRFSRIGLPEGELTVKAGGENVRRALPLPNHAACLEHLAAELAQRGLEGFAAVSHRVVHGGPKYFDPARVTPELLSDLRGLEPYAPNHLPAAIALMEGIGERHPKVPQLACFDTLFHRDLPLAAKLLPLPRRYAARGVHRYGFHGLAFASLLDGLHQALGDTLPRRMIFAHLGNGASMAAVLDGRSVDTTMGFTPAAGLVMSSRTGDLDPGLVAFLARTEKFDPFKFEIMVTQQSGLLGLSETSSDMRDLLAREASDSRAAEAIAVFCHQGRKFIGALAAVLGGVDLLAFSGGIGENAATIRERLCAGLEFLGVELDPARNATHGPVISRENSRVTVRVVPADEEAQLLAAACRLLL